MTAPVIHSKLFNSRQSYWYKSVEQIIGDTIQSPTHMNTYSIIIISSCFFIEQITILTRLEWFIWIIGFHVHVHVYDLDEKVIPLKWLNMSNQLPTTPVLCQKFNLLFPSLLYEVILYYTILKYLNCFWQISSKKWNILVKNSRRILTKMQTFSPSCFSSGRYHFSKSAIKKH